MGVGDVAHEQQRERADQRVDADLRQQPGEDRRDRRRRGVIRGRQPEEQREQGRLDAEGDQEQHCQRGHERRVRDGGQPAGQVRHVQRARHAVEQADRRQEERRRQQVERDVLDRAFELGALAAQRHQDERPHQQHFEPDVQVEDVAGQERPADPHQHRLEQRVEAERLAPDVQVGRGKHRDRQAADRRQQHHDRPEQVRDEGDAERGRPGADLGRLDAITCHGREQHSRRGEQSQRAGHAEPALHHPRAPGEQGHGRRRQRDHDRQDQQGVHSSVDRIASRSSVPTVW